jgi:hypothetical protein
MERILMPLSWEQPGTRTIEVRLRASWPLPQDETTPPSLEFNVPLPEHRGWTLAQIEAAAVTYIRDHLPRAAAALPPVQP